MDGPICKDCATPWVIVWIWNARGQTYLPFAEPHRHEGGSS